MATSQFTQHPLGSPLDGTILNNNWQLAEDSISDLGPLIISGLALSNPGGLAVAVATGVASIGGRRTVSVGFNITGLVDATTNHLYLNANGSGTSNTTGVQPANTVKLGTAVTAGGVVTTINTNWASGRQTKVRAESLIHGGGAGHPRALDLASWHATNNEGTEAKGTLPDGALSANIPRLSATNAFLAAITGTSITLSGDLLAQNILVNQQLRGSSANGTFRFAVASVTHDNSAAYTVPAASAMDFILNVGGTLTAARDLVLPLSTGACYLIRNNTTGGFAITAKGSSGTGVSIVSGAVSLVFSAGANFFGGRLT